MLERDSLGIDQSDLSNLQKVVTCTCLRLVPWPPSEGAMQQHREHRTAAIATPCAAYVHVALHIGICTLAVDHTTDPNAHVSSTAAAYVTHMSPSSVSAAGSGDGQNQSGGCGGSFCIQGRGNLPAPNWDHQFPPHS